ncbi:MAG: hypothetical protein Q8941_23060 [Bacteroidota bacterium]|nr:hypothetical protein [Bacteroidota bacterium]
MKYIFVTIFFVAFSIFGNAQTSFKRIDFTNSKTGVADYCFDYVFPFTDGQGNPDSINILIYRQVFEDLNFSDSTIIHICKTATNESKSYLNDKASYEINHSKNYVISVFTDKKGIKSATLIWFFIGNIKGDKKYFTLSAGYDKTGNIFDKYIAHE